MTLAHRFRVGIQACQGVVNERFGWREWRLGVGVGETLGVVQSVVY
jgi:hypothetical protein